MMAVNKNTVKDGNSVYKQDFEKSKIWRPHGYAPVQKLYLMCDLYTCN